MKVIAGEYCVIGDLANDTFMRNRHMSAKDNLEKNIIVQPMYCK